MDETKELALFQKALYLACEEVVSVDEFNCPGCLKNNLLNFPEGCNVPKEKFAYCWKKHFLFMAEAELKKE